MSHRPERKEKDCLNCGTIVHGKYCHVCGQENVVPKESFWGMVTHFFNDITHFDGKFFTTMGILFRKPGFLSSEYVAGRRNRYLNPVRMYVFTSAIFFLIIFSLFPAKKLFTGNNAAIADRFDAAAAKDSAMARAKTAADSANVQSVFSFFSNAPVPEADTVKRKVRYSTSSSANRYQSVQEYDSVQASLPAGKRDNWLERALTRKVVELNVRYKGRNDELMAHLADKFLHTFPYLLFVSLPLYALFLYLLYIRRRKQLYYADHGLFLVHLYIFTFLLMLLYFVLQKVKVNWEAYWLNYIQAALLLYGVYYALRAMKNFYRQGWAKTILKFILFNLICILTLALLFAAFLSYSIYQA